MGVSPSYPLLKELSYLLLGKMDHETLILLEEKIAKLKGTMRQLDDQKLKLEADINFLNREKQILMKALDYYNEIERKIDSLSSKNIQLESQLKALMSAIENMEQSFKKDDQ